MLRLRWLCTSVWVGPTWTKLTLALFNTVVKERGNAHEQCSWAPQIECVLSCHRTVNFQGMQKRVCSTIPWSLLWLDRRRRMSDHSICWSASLISMSCSAVTCDILTLWLYYSFAFWCGFECRLWIWLFEYVVYCLFTDTILYSLMGPHHKTWGPKFFISAYTQWFHNRSCCMIN